MAAVIPLQAIVVGPSQPSQPIFNAQATNPAIISHLTLPSPLATRIEVAQFINLVLCNSDLNFLDTRSTSLRRIVEVWPYNDNTLRHATTNEIHAACRNRVIGAELVTIIADLKQREQVLVI